MRFLPIIGLLASASLVIGHPLAEAEPLPAPIAEVKDTPPDLVIKLKDVDPDATINGEPVTDDIVVQSFWFNNATAEEKQKRRDIIMKRYTHNCYTGPIWILQDQLYRGKNAFCTALGDSGGISFGASTTSHGHYFQAANGNWEHFRDITGTQRDVWFYLKAPNGAAWDWNECFNAMFELIWLCRGSNPDTAGGQLWGWSTGWDSGLSFSSHS
ncbi:hypothetical protein ABW19_dt0209301 [Dactylella cylindrospora]|nr:hypothetical protein ABW19_dt0209301 [Dactylella cylindrospora]